VAEAAQPRPSVRSAMSRMSQKRTWLELPLLARSGHCLTYAPSVCGQLFANYFDGRGNDAGAFGIPTEVVPRTAL
jgi:hypothetical protein